MRSGGITLILWTIQFVPLLALHAVSPSHAATAVFQRAQANSKGCFAAYACEARSCGCLSYKVSGKQRRGTQVGGEVQVWQKPTILQGTSGSERLGVNELDRMYERYKGIQKDGDLLRGTISSIQSDGTIEVNVFGTDGKQEELDAVGDTKLEELDYGETLIGSVINFRILCVELIEKHIKATIKVPASVLRNQKIFSLHKQAILQDSSKAKLLDWKRRYSAVILGFFNSVALVKIASTELIGFVLRRELPHYIVENSTVLVRVTRLSPVAPVVLPKGINLPKLLNQKTSAPGIPTEFIFLSITPHAELITAIEKHKKPLEKKASFGTGKSDAKYKRDMKDELLEDELLDVLGSHYYKRLKRERHKREFTNTITDELTDEERNPFLELGEYLLDPDKRKLVTTEMVLQYDSTMKENFKILKTLNLQDILKKFIFAKHYLALFNAEPDSKIYRLKHALSGKALIGKGTIENMRHLTVEAKHILIRLFVNVTDPLENINRMIEQEKRDLSPSLRKVFDDELSKKPKMPSQPPTYQEALQQQRSMRSARNTTSQSFDTMDYSEQSLGRVRKYESMLKTSLKSVKKPFIHHDTSEYEHTKDEKAYSAMDKLKYHGDKSNTLRIPTGGSQ